ncbi:phosphoesterase PA-phosphatase [Pseudonocardiaceae bacterium YIM PH 21723]|nr:phosphoesterase PA-phosphatase [Pseudonocardiaceae bacterium YIM PH 21723]
MSLRAAKVVTEVLAPTVVLIAELIAVALISAGPVKGLGWAALVMCSVLLPFGFVLWGARTGRWDGHHVRGREHRTLPLLVGLGSVLAGLVLLVVLDGPRNLIAVEVAVVVGIIVTVVVTRWWKISVHAGVAAGAVTNLVQILGPWWLLLVPLVVLVGWSRVRLTDHTAAQVTVGAVVNAAIAGTVFALVS